MNATKRKNPGVPKTPRKKRSGDQQVTGEQLPNDTQDTSPVEPTEADQGSENGAVDEVVSGLMVGDRVRILKAPRYQGKLAVVQELDGNVAWVLPESPDARFKMSVHVNYLELVERGSGDAPVVEERSPDDEPEEKPAVGEDARFKPGDIVRIEGEPGEWLIKEIGPSRAIVEAAGEKKWTRSPSVERLRSLDDEDSDEDEETAFEVGDRVRLKDGSVWTVKRIGASRALIQSVESDMKKTVPVGELRSPDDESDVVDLSPGDYVGCVRTPRGFDADVAFLVQGIDSEGMVTLRQGGETVRTPLSNVYPAPPEMIRDEDSDDAEGEAQGEAIAPLAPLPFQPLALKPGDFVRVNADDDLTGEVVEVKAVIGTDVKIEFQGLELLYPIRVIEPYADQIELIPSNLDAEIDRRYKESVEAVLELERTGSKFLMALFRLGEVLAQKRNSPEIRHGREKKAAGDTRLTWSEYLEAKGIEEQRAQRSVRLYERHKKDPSRLTNLTSLAEALGWSAPQIPAAVEEEPETTPDPRSCFTCVHRIPNGGKQHSCALGEFTGYLSADFAREVQQCGWVAGPATEYKDLADQVEGVRDRHNAAVEQSRAANLPNGAMMEAERGSGRTANPEIPPVGTFPGTPPTLDYVQEEASCHNCFRKQDQEGGARYSCGASQFKYSIPSEADWAIAQDGCDSYESNIDWEKWDKRNEAEVSEDDTQSALSVLVEVSGLYPVLTALAAMLSDDELKKVSEFMSGIYRDRSHTSETVEVTVNA